MASLVEFIIFPNPVSFEVSFFLVIIFRLLFPSWEGGRSFPGSILENGGKGMKGSKSCN